MCLLFAFSQGNVKQITFMKISSEKNRRQIFGLLLILFNKIAHPYIQFCCTFETFMLYKILTEVSCVTI